MFNENDFEDHAGYEVSNLPTSCNHNLVWHAKTFVEKLSWVALKQINFSLQIN